MNSDLELVVSNVRYDGSSGEYRADVQVHNNGTPTGRDVAVEFTGLPAEVSLRNSTATSPGGNPYISFRDAIRAGGLDRGATSDAIEVVFDVVNNTRFAWTVDLWSGQPNRPPVFEPIAPVIVTVGDAIDIALSATDPDGDPVSFMLTPTGNMPTLTLNANGSLRVTPTPGDIGSYSFDLHASDGRSKTTQTIDVTVADDTGISTRISGQVLDVDGEPLVAVPIEIAGFSAVTDDDGRFTITLPTMTVPTEAFNIAIPMGDPILDPFNTGEQEIPFRRARYDVTTGDSVFNPRQHPNLVTSFIDASMVYGSDDARAAALRTFTNGTLKTSDGDLLPLNNAATFPDGTLENDNAGRLDPATLFAAGDVRANENVALLSLQTLLSANIIAWQARSKPPTRPSTMKKSISKLAGWSGAIIQHITYNEYLPMLLGEGAIPSFTSYDPNIDPGIAAIFSTAAFRLGHTQLFDQILRLDENGDSLPGGSLPLANAFFTPEPIKADGIEPYLRGLAASVAQDADVHVIDAVRNFLFGPPGAGGMDLAAMNIQRGRDLGLPSYNQARLDFDLPAVTSFSQISSDAAAQSALQTAYGTVDKVDVFVCGIAEDHVAGSMVGPLFRAILVDQFTRTRDGDRFWYENEQFTATELQTIRATTLTDLIERNTDITSLPASVFTTGTVPARPATGGSATDGVTSDYRKRGRIGK